MPPAPQAEPRNETAACKVSQAEKADLRFVASADRTTESELLRTRTIAWVVVRAAAIRKSLPALESVEVAS